jgi:hypothetical protein
MQIYPSCIREKILVSPFSQDLFDERQLSLQEYMFTVFDTCSIDKLADEPVKGQIELKTFGSMLTWLIQ